MHAVSKTLLASGFGHERNIFQGVALGAVVASLTLVSTAAVAGTG
jgi:hypothetical protein